ncbi:Abi-domain-containing protein [Coccomyxa subellipsoidea C-169]|uniref:intramembrane prenyl-peptidase Rce1 n=1 Tax=Coccomyxa subellipsoidea (strain C-169) TaxID=574566 RepID=I0Z2B3_COCSC|nr:Abi-domain-containing protein [Coccomyxa subellipsoidea C-169]EIE24782.1 Abi-domain-containing protein [Coccomyxa subellipsoidea C-169]|eukprot:XP_005649326.1 Abi-domain-containing protein [Coccomyxa subellipsoidea C-169]
MLRTLLDCLLISTAYVAPFYLQTGLSRSHTKVILSRFLSTALVCAVAWLPLFFALSRLQASLTAPESPYILIHALLGLRLSGLGAAVTLPVLLTAALFLGPLTVWTLDWYQGVLAGRRGRPLIQVERLHLLSLKEHMGVQLLRDIVMGPLTEEFAFRSCMAPLLLLQGLSAGRTILVTPLFFGLAHVHHLYEYVVHQRRSLATALFAVTFQFGFTTLFGWFATFVFLRTGHLGAAVAVHSFCNLMGFPDFGALRSHPTRGLVRAAFGLGICLFCALLVPLTRPALYHNLATSADAGNAYLAKLQYLRQSSV